MGWQDAPVVEAQVGGKATWESAPLVDNTQWQNLPAYEPGPYSTIPEKQIMGPWEVVGEPALNMATGIGSTALGGLVGAGTMIGAGFSGDLAKPGGFDKSMQLAGNRIQSIQQAGTYQPRSTAGKVVSHVAMWPMEKATEGWGMIGEQVGNALGDADTAAAGKALGQGGFQTLMTLGPKPWKLGEAPAPTEASLMNELGQVTNKGFAIGIKPSVKGQSRYKSVLNQDKLNAETVKSILQDKDVLQYKDAYGSVYEEGRIPKTVDEFAQAHHQRKLKVLEEAEAANTAAGAAGTVVPLDGTIAALKDFVSKTYNRDNFKEAVAYAEEKIADFEARGVYTPQEAQGAMTIFNSSAEIFKKTPTTAASAKATIDGIIAEATKKALNNTVENSQGPGYAAKRKELGALISSEEGITKAVLRTRKNDTTSPLGFMDVFSLSNIAKGIKTGDWTSVAKGLGLGIVSEKIRIGRDPNAAIATMFKKADKINSRLQGLLSEKEASAIVAELEPQIQKMLPPPERGFSMRNPEDVYSPYSPELGEYKNQLALPPGERGFTMRNPEEVYSPFEPRQIGVWESLIKMAQDPAGRRVLIEKLGKEKKYTGLLRTLLDVEPLEALPSNPRPNLLDYSPNTDMNQTQVWRIGDKGTYRDQIQQYQIQPSGYVQPVTPPASLNKTKVYKVNNQNALGQ